MGGGGERRLQKVAKDRTANADEKSALEKLVPELDAGKAARQVDLSKEELEQIKGLGLLSAKPIIYAACT